MLTLSYELSYVVTNHPHISGHTHHQRYLLFISSSAWVGRTGFSMVVQRPGLLPLCGSPSLPEPCPALRHPVDEKGQRTEGEKKRKVKWRREDTEKVPQLFTSLAEGGCPSRGSSSADKTSHMTLPGCKEGWACHLHVCQGNATLYAYC